MVLLLSLGYIIRKSHRDKTSIPLSSKLLVVVTVSRILKTEVYESNKRTQRVGEIYLCNISNSKLNTT